MWRACVNDHPPLFPTQVVGLCLQLLCAPKKTRISPLAPAWKDQAQRTSPHPGSTHAPLSPLGARWWRDGMVSPQPHTVLTREEEHQQHGAPRAAAVRGTGRYVLKNCPWGKPGSPLTIEPHFRLCRGQTNGKHESAEPSPEPTASGKVGAS